MMTMASITAMVPKAPNMKPHFRRRVTLVSEPFGCVVSTFKALACLLL